MVVHAGKADKPLFNASSGRMGATSVKVTNVKYWMVSKKQMGSFSRKGLKRKKRSIRIKETKDKLIGGNMNTEYAKAFKEVLSILDQVQKKEKNKIPDDFLTFLQKYASEDYQPQFCENQELKQLELTKEAKAILSILYRNYICEKKIEGENHFQEEVQMDSTNQEKNENPPIKQEEEKLWYPVIPKKENIFKRFFKKIKRIFKKEIF